MPSSVSVSVSVSAADTPTTNERLATPKPAQATPTTAQPIRVQNDTHDTPAGHESKGTFQTTAQKPPRQKRGFFSFFSKRTTQQEPSVSVHETSVLTQQEPSVSVQETSVLVQGGKLGTLLQFESPFFNSQTKSFCVFS